MEILGILAFVVALLLSVMVHEFGHYITARKFNMKVTEFFLGFGKRIWSFRKGETEYGIKAIPAGGYCKISGMTPDEVMDPGEESRAFYIARSSKKLIVLGAGSFLHFVLGIVLLFTLLAGVGVNSLTSVVKEVVPDSSAVVAGFQQGDEIQSINGEEVTDWGRGVELIRASNGGELTFTVIRDGQSLDLRATPRLTDVGGEQRYVLGIINEVGTKRFGILKAGKESLSITGSMTVQSLKSLALLPAKIPELWGQTFGGEERDADGLVGVVGVARVSGETLASGDQNWSQRLGTFLLIIASLNIFVGVFNLLPILPLDGGHMAVAIADEIRAFIARLRGRPRPAPINVQVLTPITAVVVIILIALTLLLLVADIINPISLNG
jgi:membrane-associated protease RseP (regulator of RpoE activity)